MAPRDNEPEVLTTAELYRLKAAKPEHCSPLLAIAFILAGQPVRLTYTREPV